MDFENNPRCEYAWNPGVWPYTTRCIKDADHDGNHENAYGKEVPTEGGK